MNKAVLKQVGVIGTICIAIVVTLSSLISSWFTPERDTIYYLYSSLVQGFAAIVGLLLVALGFGYDSLRKAQQVYWTDVQETAKELFGGIPEDYRDNMEMIRQHVISWFNGDSYGDLARKQTKDLDRLESVYSAKSYSGNPLALDPEMGKMWERHQNLKAKTYRYRKLVSSLGRFHNSNEAFVRFPQDFILGTAAPLGVFLASFIFLGVVDQTENYWSLITAGLIIASILATILVARFMQITIRILFGGGWIEGFIETGLPRPDSIQKILDRGEAFVKGLLRT